MANTILVVGDSLSAAYGIPTEQGWVSLLQERLVAEQHDFSIVNASISGDTTAGGRARLPRALEQHQPDIVILELGGNDGLRGLSIDEMQRNLAAMIQTAIDNVPDGTKIYVPIKTLNSGTQRQSTKDYYYESI